MQAAASCQRQETVMARVDAPFTPAQVESINGFQRSGRWHPFTCRDRGESLHLDYGEGDHGMLVAEEDGLRCRDCGYRQTWVHDLMADGTWQDR
jgi:hypothetical protein